MATKSVKVIQAVYVVMCLQKLMLAIEEKWPSWSPKCVCIQQDNAKPHPKPRTNQDVNKKLSEMVICGWDVEFMNQPPNSSDCNVQDLAFVHAIQSIQYTKYAKNVDKLMVNVLEAYNELPLDTCKKVWTTAQMVMKEVICNGGGNIYKLPHAQKDKLVQMLQRDIPALSLPCQAKIDGGALSGQVIVESMQGEQDTTPNSTIRSFSYFNRDMIDWGSNGCFDFDDMYAVIGDIEPGDVMDIDGEDEVNVDEVDEDEV